jgi:membrane associated rhomboid family serine protease
LEPLDFLALLGGSIAVGTLVARLRGARPIGSPVAAVLVLVLGGWGLWRGAQWAVIAACVLAFGAIYLPLRLFARARRRAQWGDYAAAARAVRWVAILRHDPLAAAWARTWAAGDAHVRGDPEPAARLLLELEGDPRPFARTLQAWLVGIRRDWPRALDVPAADLMLRARCELGEVEASVEALETLWPERARRMGWNALDRLRGATLAPLAFSGQVDDTARLATLLRLPPPSRAIWVATARAAAGQASAARADLERVLARPKLAAGLRAAAHARLDALPLPVRLGPAARSTLARVHDEIRAGWVVRLQPPWRRLSVLFSILVLFAAFALQAVRGGTTDGQVAFELGALLPDGHLPGQLSRLLTYGLLHYGVLHLATNVVAIALVGPVVANALRGVGYTLVLVGSVVGAGLGISFFGGHDLTLGASGGAMGLMGAIVAITLFHPQVRRTVTASVLTRMAVALVLLQSTFDALAPEVSSTGHLAGGLWGFLLAVILVHLWPATE